MPAEHTDVPDSTQVEDALLEPAPGPD
jgi:hypothetical protein